MTNSLSFPNMFDVARNKVGVIEDNVSVVNRVKLLFLTEPTELYNNPTFGAGLKRYLWQYNTENTKALIRDKLVEQLRLFEPSCRPDDTTFVDGLLFTDTPSVETYQDLSKLKMTIGVQTAYGDTLKITTE